MQRIRSHHLGILGLLVSLLTLQSCGSTTTVNVTLSPVSPAAAALQFDPAVRDVVIVLTSQLVAVDILDSNGNVAIPAGSQLDSDGDGNPDSLIYPGTCTVALPALCGFDADSSTFDLSGIPTRQQYLFAIRFRDQSGTPLYEGSQIFNSAPTLPTTLTVSIDVAM